MSSSSPGMSSTFAPAAAEEQSARAGKQHGDGSRFGNRDDASTGEVFVRLERCAAGTASVGAGSKLLDAAEEQPPHFQTILAGAEK